MIILDTNVISETMSPPVNPGVVRWLDRQEADTLYTTSVTIAELKQGIEQLPFGRKRVRLEKTFNDGVLAIFADRILDFDSAAALEFAVCTNEARTLGKTVNVADGYISGIAAANKMTVATRDTIPFEAMGINTINPWES